MNQATAQPFADTLAEPLDIDEEVLDSALMELLTSDFTPLEGKADAPHESAPLA
jgi:hypothetical protein